MKKETRGSKTRYTFTFPDGSVQTVMSNNPGFISARIIEGNEPLSFGGRKASKYAIASLSSKSVPPMDVRVKYHSDHCRSTRIERLE